VIAGFAARRATTSPGNSLRLPSEDLTGQQRMAAAHLLLVHLPLCPSPSLYVASGS
jgi:hypothetical protein